MPWTTTQKTKQGGVVRSRAHAAHFRGSNRQGAQTSPELSGKTPCLQHRGPRRESKIIFPSAVRKLIFRAGHWSSKSCKNRLSFLFSHSIILGKLRHVTVLNLAAIKGDDLPKIDHDSQGSVDQWGRDQIYPDPYTHGSLIQMVYSYTHGDFVGETWGNEHITSFQHSSLQNHRKSEVSFYAACPKSRPRSEPKSHPRLDAALPSPKLIRFLGAYDGEQNHGSATFLCTTEHLNSGLRYVWYALMWLNDVEWVWMGLINPFWTNMNLNGGWLGKNTLFHKDWFVWTQVHGHCL